MKKAQEKQQKKEISTSPLLIILNKDEEIDDLNSPTSPHLSIPIFSPTKFIFPNLKYQKQIK
ncbi:unnamed protein product (macronuclear) [Paramecium tetraurelia]|uniref:Uncharacterized protein n=1 Tax=Paramecium tetraurelia TaxID=5888 RepID=A0BG59_PARTE|nr:uncharacterized protein GSPATT00028561001 [Paramecium tetraurelia]CAK57526.1 unnamed protein product [Paramecium tetraurelia]|eukprot:XP_001424924.1 hypothetical protein (macronuclear) [Paramecium tetraurelia strain d4-2]